ncbi:hypothetical protein EDE15_4308 [Edaphobacter aggregans]|uniref:Uncharacterized protein n=1 Tax=Edaphobacter aggregans TaxID=570835 RepID=A0A428MPB2_9BACT|nr:hypothetical protein [Edaphobacter aggregans]RSL18709.1 hypothetical protein EDE15_4308 [Edaphobacter aggregans]
MSAVAKVLREQSDDLDTALESISERWHGNLSAYLDALARAKEAAEASREEQGGVRTAATITRGLNSR